MLALSLVAFATLATSMPRHFFDQESRNVVFTRPGGRPFGGIYNFYPYFLGSRPQVAASSPNGQFTIATAPPSNGQFTIATAPPSNGQFTIATAPPSNDQFTIATAPPSNGQFTIATAPPGAIVETLPSAQPLPVGEDQQPEAPAALVTSSIAPVANEGVQEVAAREVDSDEDSSESASAESNAAAVAPDASSEEESDGPLTAQVEQEEDCYDDNKEQPAPQVTEQLQTKVFTYSPEDLARLQIEPEDATKKQQE